MDVSVFGPFKRAYTSAMDEWMRNNPPHTSQSRAGRSKQKHRKAQAQIPQPNFFYFKAQAQVPQPRIFKLEAQAQIPQPKFF